MTKTLYFAPINRFGNYVFRNLALKGGADYVFSELIMAKQLEKEYENDKFKVLESDIGKTIFQIGAGSVEDINLLINELTNNLEILNLDDNNNIKSKNIKLLDKSISEINLNMGCPQSSLQQQEICGGLLYSIDKISLLTKHLKEKCLELDIIPSIKLRMGTVPNEIKINDYLKTIQDSGIKKVYIHARTLKYPYSKPADYTPLTKLKKDFPDMKIIINGDIDSYYSYEKTILKVDCNGVMIGRAALVNPSVFNQIKKKLKSQKEIDFFRPELNDPNIRRINQAAYINKNKKDIIIDFLSLAQNYKLKFDLVRFNLNKLLSGISGSKCILKTFNDTRSVDTAKEKIKNLEEK